MKVDFASRFTGAAFIGAGVMLWFGWFLLPVKPGTFFEPDVFGRIDERFHFWIWMFRLHIFGMVAAIVALVALASLLAGSPARVLVWPGAAVASAGLLVGALGAAFYYHHGAWGAVSLAGATAESGRAFVEALRVDTEYVTCLVRFGRVFGGLGLLLIAWGGLRDRFLPVWSSLVAGVVGLAAMALTMGLPDRLSWYQPIFHVFSFWLLATGVVLFRDGASAGTSSARR
jgi:hypothetical protein